MRISVLGGSGFIGTRLMGALLAAGHSVRNIDQRASAAYPGLSVVGDVRDVSAMRRWLADSDCVFNLAAEHGDQVRPIRLYADVNVGGARNVVEALEAHGCQRLIYISSAAVYGAQPVADERTPPQPDHPYGHSKLAAEDVYRTWAQAHPGRALTLIRPCVVFGEGHLGNVHTLIDHLRRRRFLMVGSGSNRKSIAYVGNLVDFLLGRLGDPPGVSLCNYADGPDLSSAELVDTLRRLLGLPASRIPALPRPLALRIAQLFDGYASLSGRPVGISRARIEKFCRDSQISTVHPLPPSRVSLPEALALTVADELARASAQR